jgi:Tetracyclin repressor-like, C-terminal domain
VGASGTLHAGTDADYVELEAAMMAFVDDVRSHCTATESLPRLRQLAAAHVRWRLQRPEIADLLDIAFGARTRLAALPAEHRARIRAIKRMYLDELRAVLNAGARSGTFDFDDVRVTAFAIVSLCGSAHTWFDPAGDLTIDEVAAMYADFAAGMVRAPMRVE